MTALVTPARRRLDDVVDELGYGLAQNRLLLYGGGLGVINGIAAMVIILVATSISDEWALDNLQRGLLISFFFVGKMFGSISAGYIADVWGRRPPLLLAYGIAISSLFGSSFAAGFRSMLVWRVIIGFGMGSQVGPWNAIAGEMCPSSSRMFLFVFGLCMFPLGMTYALFLAWHQDPSLRQLDWRYLTRVSAYPGLVLFFIAYLGLPESLRFLDSKGRRAAVVAELREMRRMNGRREVDVEQWDSGEPAADNGSSPLWTPMMLQVLTCLALCTFVLNYAYYSIMYALPQVLPKFDLGLSTASNMLLGTCVEIVGLIFALFLSKHASRKAALMLYLSGQASCIVVFVTCLLFVPRPDQLSAHSDVVTTKVAESLANLAVSGFKVCNSIGWVFVYVYSVEVFPTSCRAFGAAVAVSFGRVGAISSPLMYEVLHLYSGSHYQTFVPIVVISLINFFVVLQLPVETKDRQLGDISSEMTPLKAKV